MSKAKEVVMKDEAVQIDTATSLNGSNDSSDKNDGSIGDKEIVLSRNAHDKAYKYLESLEEKYASELSSMYDKVESLMKEVREASNFSIGLKNAIEQYKSNVAKDDKENFILVQFLEEFNEGFTRDKFYYTEEIHENNFKQALSLAYNASPELIGTIYDVHDCE